jgi:hypothetical protein
MIADSLNMFKNINPLCGKVELKHKNINEAFSIFTNAFSQKADNLKVVVALHFAHYNFIHNNQKAQDDTSNRSKG